MMFLDQVSHENETRETKKNFRETNSKKTLIFDV